MKRLTDRELATVLAALRQWQLEFERMDAGDVACLPHFENHTPLSTTQIDSLCERLNCLDDSPPGRRRRRTKTLARSR